MYKTCIHFLATEFQLFSTLFFKCLVFTLVYKSPVTIEVPGIYFGTQISSHYQKKNSTHNCSISENFTTIHSRLWEQSGESV